MLGYLLPKAELPKLRIRDNTEVDVVDLPDMKGRDVIVKTEIPDVDLPKLSGDLKVDKITLPDGKIKNMLNQKFQANAELPLPKLSGADIDDIKLPDGSIKTSFKPKAGFKWPKITLPEFELPDWQFGSGDRSPSPERKESKGDHDLHFGMKMPSFGFGGADIIDKRLPDGSIQTSFKPKAGFKWPKVTLPSLQMPDWEFGTSERSTSPERKQARGEHDFQFGMKMPSFGFGGKSPKIPKFDGLDGMLGYLLPRAELPKLRIRDNTEVDVIDLPDMKGRDVIVKTEIPDVDLPKLSGDLKVDKITLPDGKIKNMLNQKFQANAELPLPKLSGADIDDIKLPDGSIKTSFKPKAGFKWPKITLPEFELPDWQFGSGDRSPSPERKESKGDHDFHLGMKMPSFGFGGKGPKVPKFDGLDGMLGYLLPKAELPKLRIRDNTEVDVIDLPDMKGRDVIVKTEIPDVDVPKLSGDLKVDKITLPDGKIKNMLNQKFQANAELPLPKLSGADIDDIKLPDGSIKTSFKPKAGFKWPKITLPEFELPDWQFGSGDRSPSPERKESKGDHDFHFGMKMPSFGFGGKGPKVPKFDGLDGMLGYLLPKAELPKLRIRDNTEVDVIDLPDMKGRDVIVKTEIPDVDLPKLSGDLKVEKITLPDGKIKNMLNQKFQANAELPLPKLSGADIDDLKLPDGSIKTSFKPKAGFKWPKITLPELELPDWQFGSGDRSPSPERKESKGDHDFHFGMKMPSFGFGGKGPKVPKFDGLDGMLGYLLPKAELPKLRIRDNTEVDVIDLPDMKGRDVVVKTEIPDVDLPKLSGDLKVDKITLPDGKIKNMLNQKFQANAELPLPKLSGADIDDIKLPDGSIKTSFKPKAGFKWPKIALPEFELPDWQFGSGDRSPSPERKESKGDDDFHFGMKMPSFGFGGKGPKIPKFDGLDGMLEYLLPKADLPKLRIRDNSEVDVIDLPDMKGRDVIVKTEIPDVDLPKLSGDLKVDKITLPDGKIKNMLYQKFQANAELPLPKLSGADIDDIKLPDGSMKTSFKPKAGFKWPKIVLPELKMPNWEFRSDDRTRSPSPEKTSHGFNVKMPKFSLKGKPVKLEGVAELLSHMIPETKLPSVQFKDNSLVHVVDLPDGARKVWIDTEIPDSELPGLPEGADVLIEPLDDGTVRRIWRQSFDVDADFEIPEVEHAEMGSLTTPDGSIKRTYRPKGGFKWPEIHLPKFHLPDWHFHRGSSKERSPSPDNYQDDREHGFSIKMPSFGFGGKGTKVPKFDGLDGMLEYLLPKADLPKLRIRDNTEVDVIDHPDRKGRDVIVKTEIPDVDLPKLSGDLKVNKVTLPDGKIKNMLNQKFQANAELPLPKLSGADIDDINLPDGSIKTSFKPKAGFKWPKITLPEFELPDWQFGSGERSPSPERKESKRDHDFHFGMKMPSFGFGGKGPKVPKFDGLDGMLGYLLPKAELPKLRIRDNTEVDVIDLPDMKGRDVIVKTEIPDVDLPKLSGDLKVDKITLPDGKIRNMLNQKFRANAELPLPKLSGADIDDIKLPDGSIKTSFKPKAGFKWPKITLPELELPDWQFGSAKWMCSIYLT
ncbi:Neuroblast differentiation-associated protein AHNAK [Amphibalanus amphitrite]|uniref:Neuroblast differentiation-associated protein AHNAK n=1 Tax=Amphibalanus amphitrite TaxID=1232801 RepID=A0A6A4WPY3_AMPAM|nr:Neuroblast differentiation-associated protein AHNAK [Amphibalanus amphitrite]